MKNDVLLTRPPDDLVAFFDAGRRMDELPIGTSDRVWSAIEASLVMPPTPPAVESNASLENAGVPDLSGATMSIAAGLAKLAQPIVIGAFIAGGAAGVGLYSTVQPTPPQEQRVAAVVQAADPPPVLEPLVIEEPRPVTIALLVEEKPLRPDPEKKVAAEKPVPVPLREPNALGAERALLEMARSALARGNAEQALRALGQHHEKFPHGQLLEEKEALTVLALFSLGRLDEARNKESAFRERFPESFLLPALDALPKKP